MSPTAWPNAAAGVSHKHTDAAGLGHSVMAAAVLLRWTDSSEVDPTALMKGISRSCMLKLAYWLLAPWAGRDSTTVRFPAEMALLMTEIVGGSSVPAAVWLPLVCAPHAAMGSSRRLARARPVARVPPGSSSQGVAAQSPASAWRAARGSSRRRRATGPRAARHARRGSTKRRRGSRRA